MKAQGCWRHRDPGPGGARCGSARARRVYGSPGASSKGEIHGQKARPPAPPPAEPRDARGQGLGGQASGCLRAQRLTSSRLREEQHQEEQHQEPSYKHKHEGHTPPGLCTGSSSRCVSHARTVSHCLTPGNEGKDFMYKTESTENFPWNGLSAAPLVCRTPQLSGRVLSPQSPCDWVESESRLVRVAARLTEARQECDTRSQGASRLRKDRGRSQRLGLRRQRLLPVRDQHPGRGFQAQDHQHPTKLKAMDSAGTGGSARHGEHQAREPTGDGVPSRAPSISQPQGAGRPRAEVLPVLPSTPTSLQSQCREAKRGKRPRLVRPKQDQLREALWVTRAAAMTGLPPSAPP